MGDAPEDAPTSSSSAGGTVGITTQKLYNQVEKIERYMESLQDPSVPEAQPDRSVSKTYSETIRALKETMGNAKKALRAAEKASGLFESAANTQQRENEVMAEEARKFTKINGPRIEALATELNNVMSQIHEFAKSEDRIEQFKTFTDQNQSSAHGIKKTADSLEGFLKSLSSFHDGLNSFQQNITTAIDTSSATSELSSEVSKLTTANSNLDKAVERIDTAVNTSTLKDEVSRLDSVNKSLAGITDRISTAVDTSNLANEIGKLDTLNTNLGNAAESIRTATATSTLSAEIGKLVTANNNLGTTAESIRTATDTSALSAEVGKLVTANNELGTVAESIRTATDTSTLSAEVGKLATANNELGTVAESIRTATDTSTLSAEIGKLVTANNNLGTTAESIRTAADTSKLGEQVTTLGQTSASLQGTATRISEVLNTSKIQEHITSLGTTTNSLSTLNGEFGKVNTDLRGANTAIAGQVSALTAGTTALTTATGSVQNQHRQLGGFLETLSSHTRRITDLTTSMSDNLLGALGEHAENAGEALKSLTQAFESEGQVSKQIQKLSTQGDAFEQQLNQVTQHFEDLSTHTSSLANAAPQIGGTAEELRTRLQELESHISSLRHGIGQGSLIDGFTDVKEVLDVITERINHFGEEHDKLTSRLATEHQLSRTTNELQQVKHELHEALTREAERSTLAGLLNPIQTQLREMTARSETEKDLRYKLDRSEETNQRLTAELNRMREQYRLAASRIQLDHNKLENAEQFTALRGEVDTMHDKVDVISDYTGELSQRMDRLRNSVADEITSSLATQLNPILGRIDQSVGGRGGSTSHSSMLLRGTDSRSSRDRDHGDNAGLRGELEEAKSEIEQLRAQIEQLSGQGGRERAQQAQPQPEAAEVPVPEDRSSEGGTEPRPESRDQPSKSSDSPSKTRGKLSGLASRAVSKIGTLTSSSRARPRPESAASMTQQGEARASPRARTETDQDVTTRQDQSRLGQGTEGQGSSSSVSTIRAPRTASRIPTMPSASSLGSSSTTGRRNIAHRDFEPIAENINSPGFTFSAERHQDVAATGSPVQSTAQQTRPTAGRSGDISRKKPPRSYDSLFQASRESEDRRKLATQQGDTGRSSDRRGPQPLRSHGSTTVSSTEAESRRGLPAGQTLLSTSGFSRDQPTRSVADRPWATSETGQTRASFLPEFDSTTLGSRPFAHQYPRPAPESNVFSRPNPPPAAAAAPQETPPTSVVPLQRRASLEFIDPNEAFLTPEFRDSLYRESVEPSEKTLSTMLSPNTGQYPAKSDLWIFVGPSSGRKGRPKALEQSVLHESTKKYIQEMQKPSRDRNVEQNRPTLTACIRAVKQYKINPTPWKDKDQACDKCGRAPYDCVIFMAALASKPGSGGDPDTILLKDATPEQHYQQAAVHEELEDWARKHGDTDTANAIAQIRHGGELRGDGSLIPQAALTVE